MIHIWQVNYDLATNDESGCCRFTENKSGLVLSSDSSIVSIRRELEAHYTLDKTVKLAFIKVVSAIFIGYSINKSLC